MNTYAPTPDNNSARPRLASVTLPPLPFPIPDDDTRIITSAARVPVLSGRAWREDWYAQSPQGEPYGSYMLGEVEA